MSCRNSNNDTRTFWNSDIPSFEIQTDMDSPPYGALLPFHFQVKKVSPQPFKEKCMSEVVRIVSIIKGRYEKPSSSYCVMWYFWWGCRRNRALVTLGNERVNVYFLVNRWKVPLWYDLWLQHQARPPQQGTHCLAPTRRNQKKNKAPYYSYHRLIFLLKMGPEYSEKSIAFMKQNQEARSCFCILLWQLATKHNYRQFYWLHHCKLTVPLSKSKGA